ncbi:MAG: lipopolysaccharide transport periplasmic protein LptA [Thermodesulfobacteriota bacterium]
MTTRISTSQHHSSGTRRFTRAAARLLPCLITAICLLSADADGAEPLISKDPIHVEADLMVSRQKDNAVVFTGDVEAKQGRLTIFADEMTVHHDSRAGTGTAASGSPQIRKLVAEGNVKIVQDSLVATGDRMEFFSEQRKVLLTGNAKVWQDNNLVTGEKVELDLATETTVIEPDKKGGGRVKAFFYPDEEKK